MTIKLQKIQKMRERAALARSSKGKNFGRGKKHKHHKPTEVIDPVKMYPLALVPELFGIGTTTLRKGEAMGILNPNRVGVRKYVRGSHLMEFIEKYEQLNV